MKRAKQTKSSVDYRAKTGRQTCGNCVHMLDDGHCTLVQGLVDPKHVCDLWKR